MKRSIKTIKKESSELIFENAYIIRKFKGQIWY